MIPPGWAVVQDGRINVNTVSSTRRAAIVNWLVVVPRRLILDEDSDGLIEEIWEIEKIDMRVDAVQVAITPLLSASPPLPEVGDETVERMALAIQAADNTASGPMEGAASGLSDEVSDWGAFLARAALSVLSDDTGGRG